MASTATGDGSHGQPQVAPAVPASHSQPPGMQQLPPSAEYAGAQHAVTTADTEQPDSRGVAVVTSADAGTSLTCSEAVYGAAGRRHGSREAAASCVMACA
jgi:hypothetical protein